ncbi:PorV/PorQ family protein [Saprospiraceae bacterium]|nr:PorV/PorQ family protein [Saprospiraceae bacterium]
MKNLIQSLLLILVFMVSAFAVTAGNPDRQGEAGASELLLNPWARSAGIHSMSTASVSGVEAMRINVAGLGRINSGEFMLANTRLYEGSTLGMNTLGFATKVGESSAFGVTLTAMDFGDIQITTEEQPEGTGGTYSPSFFQIGLGYAYTYENKISVGMLVRGITESLPSSSAFGIAIDAGVQYVSGAKDNFKLGISLRNTGSSMEFGGEGLSFQTTAPDDNGNPYTLTVESRSEDFELPSMLNIGLSYDFYIGEENFVRAIGNFTSNAFSTDQMGVGAEFYFKDLVILRGGYKYDLDVAEGQKNLYSGVATGVSLMIPTKKDSDRKFVIDYAYRTTNPFDGTHNLTLGLAF